MSKRLRVIGETVPEVSRGKRRRRFAVQEGSKVLAVLYPGSTNKMSQEQRRRYEAVKKWVKKHEDDEDDGMLVCCAEDHEGSRKRPRKEFNTANPPQCAACRGVEMEPDNARYEVLGKAPPRKGRERFVFKWDEEVTSGWNPSAGLQA